jgi:GNAT superfamily N-acetyltransferase
MVQRNVVERHVVRLRVGVIDVTVLTSESAVELSDVLGEMRASGARRAPAEDRVDEPNVFGVVAGTAPVMWATAGAVAHQVAGIAGERPELCEIYVERGASDVAEALVNAGWRGCGESQHVAFAGPVSPLAEVTPGYVICECTDPAMIPVVRELLIEATDSPRHVIEAGYPDDFFERAAPVHLLVAETPGGELAGVIAYRRQGSAAMLFALAVTSAHRGANLGAALARAATAAALGEGASFVHALVEPDGERVARSVGFRTVATWMRLHRDAS